MSSFLITNIKQLVNTRSVTHLLRGKDLADLPGIENAYLIVEDGVIAEYGSMVNGQLSMDKFTKVVDAKDQFVFHAGAIHIHILFLQEAGKKNS